MDLTTKTIHMATVRGTALTQITLDDDFIVPDVQPDIERLIADQGNLVITDVRKTPGKADISGQLEFHVLYQAPGGQLASPLSDKLTFSERINLENLEERDYLQVQGEIEDLSVDIINSRKISVKAIVTLTLTAEGLSDEDLPLEVYGPAAETIREPLEISRLALRHKDTCRVKDEFDLPSSLPVIGNLLWTQGALRSIELLTGDGRLMLNGELEIFCLYKGEAEHIPIQWVEKTVPIHQTIELPAVTQEMIPFGDIRLGSCSIKAEADYDGELRVITAEAIIDLDLQLYEEERFSIVSDLYSPELELVPEYHIAQLENILTRNSANIKVNGKLSVKSDDRILQIIHADGKVSLDEQHPTGDGIALEGTLTVRVMFLTANDSMPIQSITGVLPFSYTIDAAGIDDNCLYQLNPSVEFLNAMMLGGSDLEIKAAIRADALVRRQFPCPLIIRVEERPFDEKKIHQLPGIVGYVVQDGDTLWKLAKRFHATVDSIRSLNQLTGDELRKGQRLLIMKQSKL
ncbi:MAG: DUF3794 domain-containing protein [Lachnospiraceae bacterium]|nr:DUF3794 domain-containing protein [Lachnospiraceae bacterium]